MVKSYLRYDPAISFGVIASGDSNICYDPSGCHLLSPALEKFFSWDLKKGLPFLTFSLSSQTNHSLAITSLASASSPSISVASGHADGSVRLWDGEKGGICEATLNGHRSAVTALRYNGSGSMLASGSKDCDVILWDVIGEAGLFRLRGHRDQVTDLVFLDSGRKLATCSKDKFVRVWDLETQQSLQILGNHRSEIWSLDVDPNDRYLVTGSADPELRLYQIKQGNMGELGNGKKWDVLEPFGEIQRQSKERVATVRFGKSGTLLGCQVAGKTLEIYRVLDETEALRKAKRRVHRKKHKKSSKSATSVVNDNDADDDGVVIDPSDGPTVVAADVFKLIHTLRASKKICSFVFSPSVMSKGGLVTLSLSLNNNTLESYLVQADKVSKLYSVELHGHRSDVRSVTLNTESNLLMSTSHNAVKIWNPSTGACLRTIDSGFGLCSMFALGNRYALVGTKSGNLEIIDVGSGSTVEVMEAHTGSVRAIIPIPDESGSVVGRGFVTGGADHNIKFWEYRSVQKSEKEAKQLSVENVQTHRMKDDVLAVAVSPNAKLVAVALLDCIVEVYYLDSWKFFLSLYGHKLPVLCMDISSDGELIVTGSADKNLKIWGLDFGDCHRSIFAHADSVMDVKFVRNTHYMFSVGKDRLVKYWDADKFQLMLTLEGHHADILCLAVSSRGDFIVTGSHDRSIRRWDRSDVSFFIEEEDEKRRLESYESEMDMMENRNVPKELIPEEGSVGVPGKKTRETLTGTDTIIEALDLAEEELKRIEQHREELKAGNSSQFQPNVMMVGLSPSEYILSAVSKVHSNDLEQALLALPFSDAMKLLTYLKEWASIADKVELVSKVCMVLLQTHHSQLTTTSAARPVLTVLKDVLHEKVKECKDTIGFNLAAMDHLKELLSMRSEAPFRNAKAKLLEIRSWQQTKQQNRPGLPQGSRKNKKPKT